MTSIIIKKINLDRHTEEDGYVKMEAETGIILPQAKKHQEFLANTGRQEEASKDPPGDFRESMTLPTF